MGKIHAVRRRYLKPEDNLDKTHPARKRYIELGLGGDTATATATDMSDTEKLVGEGLRVYRRR